MINLYRSAIFFCAAIALTAQHSVANEDDAIVQYSERAVELLRDAISRETAHGQGLVPAYAESLRQVFLEAGFPPDALTIVPYGETASLVVLYEGDGSSGREPILFSSRTWTWCPPTPTAGCDIALSFRRTRPFITAAGCWITSSTSPSSPRCSYGKNLASHPIAISSLLLPGDEVLPETVQQLARDYRHLVDAEYALVVDGGGSVLNDANEAIQFQVGFAEKTYATFAMTAKNPGGHSSMPRADNAIL